MFGIPIFDHEIDLKPLCAKLQWSLTDRKKIIESLAKCAKKSNSNALFGLFGAAGVIGALFEIDCFELFWREFENSGNVHSQLMIDYESHGEPKSKKKKNDGSHLIGLFREIYHSNSALIGQLLAKIEHFQLDEKTLRYIFGLTGGETSNSVKNIMKSMSEIDQKSWVNYKPNFKYTKLSLLSSDSSSANFATIGGITLKRGSHQLQAEIGNETKKQLDHCFVSKLVSKKLDSKQGLKNFDSCFVV